MTLTLTFAKGRAMHLPGKPESAIVNAANQLPLKWGKGAPLPARAH